MNWFSQSHLFDLARRGKRLTHILAVIPLTFVFAFFGQICSLPVFIAMGSLFDFSNGTISMDGSSTLVSGTWMAMILISAFGLIYVLVGLWVFLYERRPFWTLGYERKGALSKYLLGFIFGCLLFSAVVGILALFGFVSFQGGDPTQQGLAALGGVLIILVGWIVQGGAEELITRGWVLPVLGARYRPWVGLVLSSLLFATMHILNDHLSVIALLNLALFGAFAGLYALKEGSLWGVSALHTAWNWVQGNLFGFKVSGSDFGGGKLFNLMETGPDWMTGGLFGPEGGLAVTLALIVAIGIILFWKSNTPQAETIA